MTIRAMLGGLLVVAAVGSAGPVRASIDYPKKIQEGFALPCAPQCTLCHIDNEGGLMKLVPYGERIKEHGGLWKAGAPEFTLNPVEAFERMKNIDSDGDGISDYDEIAQATDPSVAGTPSLCGGPQYGCGASAPAAPESSGGMMSFFGAFALVGAAVALRRGRRSEHES